MTDILDAFARSEALDLSIQTNILSDYNISIRPLIWNNIVQLIPNQEQQEYQRLLGSELINTNNRLSSEITSLLTILCSIKSNSNQLKQQYQSEFQYKLLPDTAAKLALKSEINLLIQQVRQRAGQRGENDLNKFIRPSTPRQSAILKQFVSNNNNNSQSRPASGTSIDSTISNNSNTNSRPSSGSNNNTTITTELPSINNSELLISTINRIQLLLIEEQKLLYKDIDDIQLLMDQEANQYINNTNTDSDNNNNNNNNPIAPASEFELRELNNQLKSVISNEIQRDRTIELLNRAPIITNKQSFTESIRGSLTPLRKQSPPVAASASVSAPAPTAASAAATTISASTVFNEHKAYEPDTNSNIDDTNTVPSIDLESDLDDTTDPSLSTIGDEFELMISKIGNMKIPNINNDDESIDYQIKSIQSGSKSKPKSIVNNKSSIRTANNNTNTVTVLASQSPSPSPPSSGVPIKNVRSTRVVSRNNKSTPTAGITGLSSINSIPAAISTNVSNTNKNKSITATSNINLSNHTELDSSIQRTLSRSTGTATASNSNIRSAPVKGIHPIPIQNKSTIINNLINSVLAAPDTVQSVSRSTPLIHTLNNSISQSKLPHNRH